MLSRENLKRGAYYALGTANRIRGYVDKEPYHTGAYPTYELAKASLPAADQCGYDDADMVEVSLDTMLHVLPWDYPVLFWLDRLLDTAERLSLLDAGGHIGTKHHAFRSHLDLKRIDWTVWDLPAVLKAGRRAQAEGQVCASLQFADRLDEVADVDILLASGLLQYVPLSFGDLVSQMAAPPRWVILNKVATRPDSPVVTLQLIGRRRVPYQIRARAAFEADIAAAGYTIRDTWTNPSLAHRIDTHPWLGESESMGYVLERV